MSGLIVQEGKIIGVQGGIIDSLLQCWDLTHIKG